MNEPGFDDAIADEAVALDRTASSPNQKIDEINKLSQHDTEYQQAARWWLASTAYPLVAVCRNLLCHPLLWKSTFSLFFSGHFRADG